MVITLVQCSGRCWSTSTTAAQYATVTAVLAGFVFTGIITVISQSGRNAMEDTGAFSKVLGTLLLSFLSLLSVTVLYAALAGDESENRAASLGVLAALAIFPAIALGLYAIVLFLEASALRDAAGIFRMYVGLILPFIALVFVYLATTEVERLASGESYSVARTIGIGCTALFAILAPVMWWRKPLRSSFASVERLLPYAGIIIVTLIGFAFSSVWASPSETLLSNLIITAIEIIAFAQSAMFATILAAGSE
jgi:hypothetical protein